MSYVKDVHFTEEEFERVFKRATERDFQVGMVYYRKVRWFVRYMGQPIILPKELVKAAVQFGSDVSSGLAYIKRDLPKINIPVPEKPEVLGEGMKEDTKEVKQEEVKTEISEPITPKVEKTEEVKEVKEVKTTKAKKAKEK